MPRWLSVFLLPFSWIYGLIILFRTWLYKSKVYTRSRFDFPVICVGNITAGGTGKTPHIEFLIRLLGAEYKMAVLSRGYRRKTSGYLLATPHSSVQDIGDEPFQVKRKYPDVAVAVAENRVLGIPALLGDAPETQVVLMDDGFQHLSIQAGFNIVLCNYHRPYYNDRLLPSGLLREPASGAARADVIIVSKCPADLGLKEQAAIIRKLDPLPHQQVFFSTLVYGDFRPLTQAAQESAYLDKPSFHKAIALAGIAKADLFVKEVSTHFEQTEVLLYSDHTDYDGEKINMIRHKAAEPRTVVITTEKDAVKLMAPDLLPLINQVPVWYLPVEIELLNDATKTLHRLLTAYIERETGNALSDQ